MMLATWLVELYLAKLNELDDLAAAAAGRAGAEKDDEAENLGIERGIVEDDMRIFLVTYKVRLSSLPVSPAPFRDAVLMCILD
jgi:hypothetical protein